MYRQTDRIAWLRRDGSRGFTIVELMLVIIVLVILAAVVVVSYRGVEDRAYNATIITNASTYQKALLVHFSLTHDYPAFDHSVGGVCLGVGYDDYTSDGKGDCGETAWYLSENAPFNNALKNDMSSMPPVSKKVINMPYQSTKWVGAAFHYYPPNPSDSVVYNQGGFMVDNVSAPYYIMYILLGGNTNCGVNVVTPDTNNGNWGWPRMSTVAAPSQRYSWSDGKTTACVVAMPTP